MKNGLIILILLLLLAACNGADNSSDSQTETSGTGDTAVPDTSSESEVEADEVARPEGWSEATQS